MGLRCLMVGILALALACGDDDGDGDMMDDGMSGDGDGDTATGGDGDGDTGASGDGDGDTGAAGDGDGDGDATAGDGDGDGDAAGGSALAHIAGGVFGPLDGYDGSTASGVGLIVVGDDGTEVSLQVSGLTADTAYGAHVHALPCSLAGGGHYKLDPAVEEALEDNELWPAFTTDENGDATVTIANDHIARADAMSIVIHDAEADNAKMICADLVPTDFETARYSGSFASFAAAEAGDEGITGSASLERSASGTTIEIAVEGLSGDEEYASHVHALPCGVGDGGGHYKIDPAVEAAEEDNELWPAVAPDADGKAEDTIDTDHVARADAQSIVIHRKTADAAPKVACADLSLDAPSTFVTSGDAVAFELAGDRDLGDLAGSAEMKRKLDGTTTVEVELSGLDADTEYPIHVHDRACDVASGGGHYKIDAGESETIEDNEIWLTLTTDSTGAGAREVSSDHVARAEAQALVIHDTDGMRLACIDLR